MGGAAGQHTRVPAAAASRWRTGRHHRCLRRRGDHRRRVRTAQPGRRGRRRLHRAAADRAPDRLHLLGRPVPVPGSAERQSSQLPVRPADDGAAAGHRPTVDRRRCRDRQDHRSRAGGLRAARAGQRPTPRGPLLARARRAMAARATREVRSGRGAGADQHREGPGTRPDAERVAVRPLPVRDHLQRLHQDRSATARVPAQVSRAGHRR